MKTNWKLFQLLFTLTFLHLGLSAQIETAVEWNNYTQPAKDIAVGDEITLIFEADIDEGFHIYSSIPPEKWPMFATIFELDEEGNSGAELVGGLKEEGHLEKEYEELYETDLLYFHDRVVFKQKVKITAENPTINGFLQYQICDTMKCIPGDQEVNYSIKTVKKKISPPTEPKTEPKPEEQNNQASTSPSTSENLAVANSPQSETQNPSTEADNEENPVSEQPPSVTPVSKTENLEEATTQETIQPKDDSDFDNRSLWELLFEGILFGFGSLLTPCIFPLIPLTVSFFTKQSSSRRIGIRNALIYGGSIIFIYTFIGLLASVLFGGDIGREIAVNPWINLFIFGLLFVFGLSFLGMFELTLPASWSNALSSKSSRGGLLGIFLMAMVLAVVSFSCVGPIVSFAFIRAAESGQLLGPMVIMLGFSAALALPFMLFAAFPGWMNSLPQSGGWLNAVKVVLGFIEIALSFIYFSRADLVMQWGLLDREIFLAGWIVLFAFIGVYLLGKMQLPHDSPLEKISVPRTLLAASSFWFALYLLPGLWGAPLPMLGGYIPPSGHDIGVKVIGGHATTANASNGHGSANENEICNYPNKVSSHLEEFSHGFCAFYDLDQGIEYAKKHNKPVFVDFTGITCANCRLLESSVWVTADIQKMIQEDYVLVSLYTDDRKKLDEAYRRKDGTKVRTVGDKWIGYEIDEYGTNTQPYYVLLDHDKSSLVPPKGFNSPPVDEQDITDYRAFFTKGLEEYKKRH